MFWKWYPCFRTIHPVSYTHLDVYKRQVLAPFMIVAGDHAQNDLAGADLDSWMNRLSSEGYEVTPVLKGLGEYPQVRQILVEHVQQAMNASI